WRNCLPKINVEQLWRFVRTYDYVAGDFMWTGIDYLGEGGVGTASGVLDTCGFRKDGYYFYQSQWTAGPMVHLLPHWNWRGVEGAWNNLPARARGPHTTGDLHLSWDVIYEAGTLRAVGMRSGRVAAVDEIATTGEPAALRLTLDRASLVADGRDVVHAVVEIVDADSRTVPTADNPVAFAVQGPARIIGVDNGSVSIAESFNGDRRLAYHGKCLAILQAGRGAGAIHLAASSPGLRGASAELSSAP